MTDTHQEDAKIGPIIMNAIKGIREPAHNILDPATSARREERKRIALAAFPALVARHGCYTFAADRAFVAADAFLAECEKQEAKP